MTTTLNSRDLALQSLTPRVLGVQSNYILLAAPVTQFNYGQDVTNANPSSLTVTAILGGILTGNVIFNVTGLFAGTNLSVANNVLTLQANSLAGETAQVTATLTYQGTQYTSLPVTVSKNYTAVTLRITRSSDIVQTDQNGLNYTLPNAINTLELYNGSAALTGAVYGINGGTVTSGVSSILQNGVRLNVNTTSGAITVTQSASNAWLSSYEKFILTATKNSVIYSTTYELYKTGGDVKDTAPPPDPTNGSLTADVNSITITLNTVPIYTQGHGHGTTVVYGSIRAIGDTVPVFSNNTTPKLAEFTGNITKIPSNPVTNWYIWIKNKSFDGVESNSAYALGNVTTSQDVTTLLKALENQINTSQLATTLSSKISLIDAADTVAGSVAARIKAVQEILQSQINDIALTPDWNIESYNLDDIVKYSGSLYKANQALTLVTKTITQSDLNIFTVASTTGLISGMGVKFSGSVFGGISTNTIYYIKTVVNSTTFSISNTLNGAERSLTTASGTMSMEAIYNPTDTNYWDKIGDYTSLGDAVTSLAAQVNNTYTEAEADQAITSAINSFKTTVSDLTNYTNTASLTANYSTITNTNNSITNAINTFKSTTELLNYSTNAKIESNYYTKTSIDDSISRVTNALIAELDGNTQVNKVYYSIAEPGITPIFTNRNSNSDPPPENLVNALLQASVGKEPYSTLFNARQYLLGDKNGRILGDIISNKAYGLKINITLANGIITSATIANGGIGYAVGLNFTIYGYGNQSAIFSITSVASGVVTAISITNGGSGYPTTDSSNITDLNTLLLNPSSTYNRTNIVSSLELLKYTNKYIVPLGVGLIINIATTNGVITGVTIVNGGDNYSTIAPVIRVSGGDGNARLSVTAVTDNNIHQVKAGSVTNITITNGGTGYSNANNVTTTTSIDDRTSISETSKTYIETIFLPIILGNPSISHTHLDKTLSYGDFGSLVGTSSKNDYWVNTNPNSPNYTKVYKYNGTSWVLASDPSVAKTFAQSDPPSAIIYPLKIGNLWVDTNDNNQLYRWDGTNWQTVRDGTIALADARITTVETTKIGYATLNSSPNVPFDNNGLITSAQDVATWNTANSGNQATWRIGLPLATAVKQISINDGTGNLIALEQRFVAQKSTNDSLGAQYTVKIDSTATNASGQLIGKVTGFGLASTATTSAVTSEFSIRADRFSIAQPVDYYQTTTPSVSVTAGKLWYNTNNFKTYRYLNGNWQETQNATSAPFIVQTSDSIAVNFYQATQPSATALNQRWKDFNDVIRVWNGSSWDIDPTAVVAGVYIDTAKIRKATITDAYITDLTANKITAGTITAAVSMTAPTIKSSIGNWTTISGSSGFWLGYDSAENPPISKFFVGNDANNYIKWTGTQLSVKGEINATSGTFKGITILDDQDNVILASGSGVASVASLANSVSGLQTTVSGLQTTVSGLPTAASFNTLNETVTALNTTVSSVSTTANNASTTANNAVTTANSVNNTITTGAFTTYIGAAAITNAMIQSVAINKLAAGIAYFPSSTSANRIVIDGTNNRILVYNGNVLRVAIGNLG